MELTGGRFSKNKAIVGINGRLYTQSSTLSVQTQASLDGDCFNLNTDNLTLTNDTETPLYYIKNTNESRPLVITRLFFGFGNSTDGVGEIDCRVYSNITSGTILSNTELPLYSFNFGLSSQLNVDSRLGGTGVTFGGGVNPIKFLFPSDNSRPDVTVDSIVLPRGASVLVTCTPPTGNTSMVVQAGLNTYKGD